MNIYGIIYKQDEGFKILKDKVEYCHSEGYFSTISGERNSQIKSYTYLHKTNKNQTFD